MNTEIQIAHVHLETPLILSDEFVQVLIVENPEEFYAMVFDLNRQFDGEQGTFVFSRNGQTVDVCKNGTIISDLFHFDLNDKKIITALYKRLEQVALGEKIILFNELTSKTMAFLSELAFEIPFAIEYGEPQPSDYFKISGLKFEKNYENLEEKIICYINALIELKGCDFFIFVNLKSVLNDERLLRLYEHCNREQVGVLLIESRKQRPLLPMEKAIIITEDLCEILENYDEML